VPDFTGTSAKDAEKALTKLQLEVDATSSYDDNVDQGFVISQDPRDGTLFKGDTVRLEVSKGPNLVEVPRVTAMGVAAAKQLLEEAGFNVETKHSGSYIGLGYVLRSDPSAGTKAAKGSTVTLFLV
jgi:beta-lactam-binding protein with PASTA domain